MNKIIFSFLCGSIIPAFGMDSNPGSIVSAPKMVELKNGVLVPFDEVTRVTENLKALAKDERLATGTKFTLFCALRARALMANFTFADWSRDILQERNLILRARALMAHFTFADWSRDVLEERNFIDPQESMTASVANIIKCSVRIIGDEFTVEDPVVIT
jgi:hypothetical protein